jgi:hypothetical protein
MNALPRSLRALMQEASLALERNRKTPVSAEEFSLLTNADLERRNDDSWLRELSRGEYSQALYWRCVAEDCEEDCDWEGAIGAYLEIVSDPENQAVEKLGAHSHLAGLLSLLGRFDEALGHAFADTDAASSLGSELSQQLSLKRDAWLLVELGRIDEAQHRLQQGRSLGRRDAHPMSMLTSSSCWRIATYANGSFGGPGGGSAVLRALSRNACSSGTLTYR